VLKRTAKLVVATLVAATLPFTLAACSKGGTSSSSATSGGTQTLTMWTHNAGNKAELAAVQQIVTDYNASQAKYKVDLQAFPQDSYNQSVVAAAASKSLPCVLDIDGPNVPNWAWAGYLAPLTGLDDVLLGGGGSVGRILIRSADGTFTGPGAVFSVVKTLDTLQKI